MIYIGIDPGSNGAIVVLDDRLLSLQTVTFALKHRSEREILDFLQSYSVAGITYAALEHVWSTPGQGGAFAFGRNVGHLQMALTAAKIPFDLVLPRAWQKALDVRYAKGTTDTERKNITKRRAEQLYPRIGTITHAIADALLIAEHCRRQRGQYGETEKRRAQGNTEARPTGGQSSEVAPWAQASYRRAAARDGRHGASAARADGGNRRRDQAQRRGRA